MVMMSVPTTSNRTSGRVTPRRVTEAVSGGAATASAAVALLVFLTRPAPAWIVPADPLSGGRVPHRHAVCAGGTVCRAAGPIRHRTRGPHRVRRQARCNRPRGITRDARRARRRTSSADRPSHIALCRGSATGNAGPVPVRARCGRRADGRRSRGPSPLPEQARIRHRHHLGLLSLDRDVEDGRRDLVADEVPELLVEAEGLPPELVQRVLLGVAPQPDPAAEVVHLGEVLNPQGVDRPEQHKSLDLRPDVALAVLLLAGAERVVDDRAEMLEDRLAATADLLECLLGRVVAGQAEGMDGACEAREVPLAVVVATDELVDHDLELVVEELLDRLRQVLVAEDLVAFRVDRLTLPVDDVVELDDALAEVEVEALDAGLGRLDRA